MFLSNGYRFIHARQHPKADKDGYVREHVLVVEKALGRFLPDKAVVHHINEIKSDNRNENLVICQDEAYHQHLHFRAKAQAACGNANWLQCRFCKVWDVPDEIYQTPVGL